MAYVSAFGNWKYGANKPKKKRSKSRKTRIVYRYKKRKSSSGRRATRAGSNSFPQSKTFKYAKAGAPIAKAVGSGLWRGSKWVGGKVYKRASSAWSNRKSPYKKGEAMRAEKGEEIIIEGKK